ncbi:MAG: hypothetical protein JSR87_08350 [Proteobacteria bacterium]|nr:hypothetical protein [Pseudomonadota bacterium]MBS0572766.1 hypothetical protein [Pseudomonadota bacterium]
MGNGRGRGRTGAAALLLAMVVLASGCRSDRGAALPPVGEAQMDVYHKACVKGGGDYLRLGSGKTFTCESLPDDAGKYCTKSSDCESACLSRSHSCAPVRPLLGCNDVLDGNGSAVTQCVN